MKKQIWKEVAAALVLLLLLFLFSNITAALLIPERVDYGATWRSYLKEEPNTVDVLFYGSSIAYCDIVPAVIWEQSGISSYVMGGPEQTIPLTYYYMKETLRTQHPKVLALEVTGVFFERYEHYTKVNIGYMPWGLNRLEASCRAAESAEQPGLFFPLLQYHSRWKDVTRSELQQRSTAAQPDKQAGYTFLSDRATVTVQPRDTFSAPDVYAENIDYLKQMAALCKEEGIELLCFLAPTCRPLPDAQAADLENQLSKIEGLTFRNWSTHAASLGVNLDTDFFDALHFNYLGAEKFSVFLADVLQEEYRLQPSAQASPALWSERVTHFHALADGIE